MSEGINRKKAKCDNLDDNQKQLRNYQKKVKKVISVNLIEKRIYKKRGQQTKKRKHDNQSR